MKKKIGAFGAGQFSLGTLAGGRPGTTIFQNPGGGGGLGGVAYKDRARPPPRGSGGATNMGSPAAHLAASLAATLAAGLAAALYGCASMASPAARPYTVAWRTFSSTQPTARRWRWWGTVAVLGG